MTRTVSAEFAPHLAAWGPGGETCGSLAEANRYCRDLATSHYENFPVASRVLPRPLRQPMSNIYAYCRWADDLADEVSDQQESLALLAWWRQQLEHCFDGRASHPVFVALRTTIADFGFSIDPFNDLIKAFEQDQQLTSYRTFDELQAYCRWSANPVGRIVLRLIDRDTRERVALSDRVCTGLQLINFWQDVRRDSDIGRSYLPADDCQRYGYSETMLAERATNEEFRELMAFQVDRARNHLVAGAPLAASLRGRFRVAIDLFARGGLAICDACERIDFDLWKTRPTVTKRRASWLAMKAIAASVTRVLR